MTSSRFDYVKYDSEATVLQNTMKMQFLTLEEMVKTLPEGRAKSLIFTKLEEAYMWVGKAIRDDQILRTTKAPLQEERKDG